MSGFSVEKINSCPDWLAEMVKPKAQQRQTVRQAANDDQVSSDASEKIQEGSRNSVMFKQACRLRGIGLGFDDAFENLKRINDSQCIVPLEHGELLAVLKSAFNYNNSEARHELTEFGNVNRMLTLFGEDIRYVP